jgi:hypothetical protein
MILSREPRLLRVTEGGDLDLVARYTRRTTMQGRGFLADGPSASPGATIDGPLTRLVRPEGRPLAYRLFMIGGAVSCGVSSRVSAGISHGTSGLAVILNAYMLCIA